MPIMSILLAIILIVLLVFIYKKREETESNLGWKIVGYFWLGAFAFKVNEMPLPLGFLLFLLIFRPMTNVKTKKRSAYLGLACFLILYLISPAVERELFERPRDVVAASNNMFQIKFTNDWRTIRDQLKIDEHARLVYFKSHIKKETTSQWRVLQKATFCGCVGKAYPFFFNNTIQTKKCSPSSLRRRAAFFRSA